MLDVNEERSHNNTTRRLARATGIVAVFTILSKILGFIRDAVIASRFGATGLTDAFTAVFFGLSAAVSMAFGIALTTGFLPIFAEFRTSGREDRAWGVARITVLISGIGTLLLSAIAVIWARPIIAAMFELDQASLDAAVQMARIILPVTFLSSLYSIFQVALNSYGMFGIPAMATSLMNILTIGGAVYLGPRYGIAGLALGAAAGMVAQVLILFAPLHRVRGLGHLFRTRPDDAARAGAKRVVALAFPSLLSQFVGQGYQLIDKGLASRLSPGVVSALGYAGRIVQVPVGVIASSVATAAFPTLASLASKRDDRGYARSLHTALRTAALFLIPFTAGLVIFRVPLTRVLLERGAFTPEATQATASALMFYAFSIIGQSFSLILNPAFSARKKTLTAFKISALGSGTNILFDYLLVGSLGYRGLALASAVAATLQATLLYLIMGREVPDVRRFNLVTPLLKMLAAAVLMAWPALKVFSALAVVWPRTGNVAEFVRLSAAAGVGAVVYFALVALFRVGGLRLPKRD
ncbi:MAG: murein biosynthesis integral membrane protein MurJ [Chloroflexota bacterium]